MLCAAYVLLGWKRIAEKPEESSKERREKGEGVVLFVYVYGRVISAIVCGGENYEHSWRFHLKPTLVLIELS